MIGIICATPEEYAAITTAMGRHSAVDLRGQRAAVGELNGFSSVVVEAGIGKINATMTAVLLIDQYLPDVIIFAGVGGGISPRVKAGDVIIATNVGCYDYGIRKATGFQYCTPGELPTVSIDCEMLVLEANDRDTDFLTELSDVLPDVDIMFGTVITADTFLNCSNTADELFIFFDADVVDMESYAVGVVAQRFEIPYWVIRTVSDKADDTSHTDYADFAAAAAKNSAALIPALIELTAHAE